jgi:hypothetical protein
MTITGYRYQCSADVSFYCDVGAGHPGRTNCRQCGSALIVETGEWGAFHWRADRLYPREHAVETFTSKPRAERYASRNSLVVRFVRTERQQPPQKENSSHGR